MEQNENKISKLIGDLLADGKINWDDLPLIIRFIADLLRNRQNGAEG